MVQSSAERSLVFCTGCRTVFAEVFSLLDSGVSVDTIANTSIAVCIQLGLGSEAVCEGLVEVNKASKVNTVAHFKRREALPFQSFVKEDFNVRL